MTTSRCHLQHYCPPPGECLALVSQLRSRAPADLQPQLLSLEAEAATLMGILIWDSSQRRQSAVPEATLIKHNWPLVKLVTG